MNDESFYFEHPGWCPVCEAPARFIAKHPWFRDHLLCTGCGSIPRERALMTVLAQYFPNWKELAIHESSPVGRGASLRLRESPGYVESQFDPRLGPGERSPAGWVNENLERQSFDDSRFDLVVTQDVLEHVFDVDAAVCEIARTLRPGGAHVFTVPLVNRSRPSRPAAVREDGGIRYLEPPEYHGNPVSSGGALVTWHFGFDLAARITSVARTPTVVFSIDRIDLGVRAEYLEVLVSFRDR